MPDELLANLSYERREQGWHHILNNVSTAHSFIYVAEEQSGQIIGFACGAMERTGHLVYQGELTAIYILDRYQQRGVGRQLVRAVVQKLDQMNIRSMLVWVLANNPACRFYETLGGQKVDEKEIERGGTKLLEIAYGWTDTSTLIQNS